MSRDVKALVLLTAIVLGTTLPFVHRAYFVDDYYFVTMAKGILQNPWRPYDFKSDDAGIANVAWERGKRPRMVNPPLFHYYLAGVIALWGESPWKLRTASLLFSFIALYSMYFLGKRFVADPLPPAILMAVCPAYWLTSYSLLIDSALVAFLLASLLVFIIGHERKHPGWIILSGLLMGLSMLLKYFGVIGVALALAWQVMDPKRRRWRPGYYAFGIYLLIQILWATWNVMTYGQSHFLAALPRGMQSPSLVSWAQKSLVLGSFIGGSFIFVLAAPAMLWRFSKTWLAALIVMSGGLYRLLCSRVGGFDSTQALLLSIFVGGTTSFLVLMARTLKPGQYKNDLFLIVWVLIGVAELIVVMPWTAGRYLLCLLPAMCWVFAIQVREVKWPAVGGVTLGVTAFMGLLLAHADLAQANTIVNLAGRLKEKAGQFQAMASKPKHHWYYLADTFDGSQPYLGPLGWENVLPQQNLKKGDLFLRAYYRKSSYWNVNTQLKKYRPVLSIKIQSRNTLRVMDVPASAGFYASCWGALPWTVTHHPLERFELYQAVSE